MLRSSSAEMSNLKKRVAELIALADEAVKISSKAALFKKECSELISKTERLASLLRDVAKVISSGDFYDRPALRILDQSQQVLEKARAILLKCVNYGSMARFFSIIPVSSFRETMCLLQDSIDDLIWLMRLWDPSDDMYLGLVKGFPPIVRHLRTFLTIIWKLIADLYNGLLDDPYDAGRANAARLIGFLSRHRIGVERMISAGVCPAFEKILRQGPMRVQAAVAGAVSELANRYPKCQDLFAPYNIICFLVSHLEFETIEGHDTEVGARKATSMHAIVMMSNNSKTAERSIINGFEEEDASRIKDSQSNWKSEDPDTKAEMKAKAAKALSVLARGNVSICRSIAETRALLCFSILLDKGSAVVKYNCAMVLLEITSVAEQDIDLKNKALVHQLQKIIEKDGPRNLIVLCIKVIGNLASTLRGMGIRMIPPLGAVFYEMKSLL